MNNNNNNKCPICRGDIQPPVGSTSTCRHSFCYSCLEEGTYFSMTYPLDSIPFYEIVKSDSVGGPIVHRVCLNFKLFPLLFINESGQNHRKFGNYMVFQMFRSIS